MPAERRRIIFSNDEVVAAALSYCRATGIPVPDAEVQRRSVCMESDGSLFLVFDVSSPDQEDDVTLDVETVLNALVEFCRVQSIPLPRAAQKRLEYHGGALSLVFDMTLERGSVNATLAA